MIRIKIKQDMFPVPISFFFCTYKFHQIVTNLDSLFTETVNFLVSAKIYRKLFMIATKFFSPRFHHIDFGGANLFHNAIITKKKTKKQQQQKRH